MWQNKTLLCDVDNVLFDFSGPFSDWIEQVKGFVPVCPRTSVWRLETLYGVSYEVMREMVEEFSISEEFAKMPPIPGAVEAITRFREAGFEIEVITACFDHADARRHREAALLDVFGIEQKHVHYVGLMQGKSDLLRRFKPAVWIEDSYENALDGAKAGHLTFLFAYGWNENLPLPGIQRVPGWPEVEYAMMANA